MFRIDDHLLMEYFREDVPYLDITTSLQQISPETHATLEIFTREDLIVSCSEEAQRIAQMIGCEVIFSLPSGKQVRKGETVLSLQGSYQMLHQVRRQAQNILEYSCKIATYTHQMKEAIVAVNPHCELLTTRKSFPFAKHFCIRSIINGGAMPHRLGLGETVLFFPQHRIVYPNDEAFYQAIATFKTKAPEKKIIVESETFDDSVILMQKGVDVIQIDKADIQILKQIVAYRNNNFPSIKILAAGGVNKENASLYAETGIDGIVTSAVYACGIANMGSKMTLLG